MAVHSVVLVDSNDVTVLLEANDGIIWVGKSGSLGCCWRFNEEGLETIPNTTLSTGVAGFSLRL